MNRLETLSTTNNQQIAVALANFEQAHAAVNAARADLFPQLAAQILQGRQLNEEHAALDAAQRALDISNNRYKTGVETYLDVIVAQAVVLTHEQSVIQLKGQRLASSAALIKALGAGWQPTATKLANVGGQ